MEEVDQSLHSSKVPIVMVSLLPYILKDVSTSKVTSKGEAIFKAQLLFLIYAQFGMLYEILPDAPRSNYSLRKNTRPHADGIIVYIFNIRGSYNSIGMRPRLLSRVVV